jgi:uncharacterized membrane protein
MSSTTRSLPSADHHSGRDTNEFARVVNLSDAVFAIAMTLLALTLDVPDVPSGELAAALRAEVPHLGVYALAFALIASQWHEHHKLFRRLAWTEPGLTVINLALLGLVALVPFPTSVLGGNLGATAAVAPFLALFVAVNLTYLSLIVRAQAVGAWIEPLPPAAFRRVVASAAAGTATLGAGIVVSIWIPLAALGLAAVSGVPMVLMLRTLPPPYRTWF